MSTLVNTSIAIFGFPRSGTKLLANVLEQQGYFNFGEFFETFSTDFIGNSLTPSRLPPEKQISIFNNINLKEFHKHASYKTDRINKFIPYVSTTLSTVTVFYHTVEMAPELFDLLYPRYFLCTRRQNRLDQLISWCLTFQQKNYNGEIKSERMKIDLQYFEHSFYKLQKTERIQDYLIAQGRAILVDFDQLINGSLDLDFAYDVTSVDQHTDLASLIINYDEILSKFNQLNLP